jgi:hypothetical protein
MTHPIAGAPKDYDKATFDRVFQVLDQRLKKLESQADQVEGSIDSALDTLKPIATSASAADLEAGIIPDARMPDLTGDVTTSEGAVATTIGANKVTNAMLAQMAQATFKMRAAGAGTGNAIDGTVTQAKTALGIATSSTAAKLLRYSDTAGTIAETGISEDGAGNLSGIVNAALSGYLDLGEIASPANPAADTARVFAKDVSGVTRLYLRDSAGTETEFIGRSEVGLILLTSGTVTTNAASLDIVLTAYTGYRALVFELDSFVPATDAVGLLMRLSTDAGSSYASTGYLTNGGRLRSGASYSPYAETTGIGLGNAHASIGMSNVASEGGWNGRVTLYRPTDSARYPSAVFEGVYLANTPSESERIMGAGMLTTAQDTDAVQFLFSSGNITSGNYALYGLK